MPKEFPDVEVEHLLVDAAAMHLLSRPADFDVMFLQGGAMLQLLKSYGITDAEIEEGLANYARKHGLAAAS